MKNDSPIGITDVLIWLSGGDRETLDRSPADRARHIGYGSMFLATAAFAAVSGAVALSMTMDVGPVAATVAGVAWGLLILAIDRMLVLSMTRTKGFRGFCVSLGTAALRIGMALVLGAVVSTPLVLRIFQPEIETEIKVMHAEEAAAFKDQLDADSRFSGIPALQQQIAQQQAIVDAGPSASPESDPAVKTARAALATAQAAYDEAEEAVVCEIEGTCGTGRRGAGIAYDEKVRIRQNAASDLRAARADLQTALATAGSTSLQRSRNQVASAREQLETDREELADLKADKTAAERAQRSTLADADGLMARLEALHRLLDKKPALASAHWLLMALFMIIETLPVLTKTLQLLAPRSLYEYLSELRDADTLAQAREASDERREVERIRSEVTRAAENDLTERRIDLQKDVNAQVVAKQKEVTEAALNAWGEQVTAHTVEEVGRWVPPRTTVIDLD
ncbi:DUF4407 domain-containing protein [Kineosporia babensis]|uniref:DUF4407 domain-containing protein n=1 Tax=Kineosporia babensis TaxID=499548 RepID=A0A9X1N937_9ACTN|nr:DUF4407 domain-containing protein [Kineosporia babensis]MCD5309539.1 DUF4407 domain-containing protein [Kineosporia babensis]